MAPLKQHPEMAIAELVKLVAYEPETGKLFWRPRDFGKPYIQLRWNRHKAGHECFCSLHKGGYLHGQLRQKAYLAHRLAWALHYGEWPNGQIDHINHRRDDNRIANLRVVDCVGNARNQVLSVKNRSGVVGVCQHKGAWQAGITVDGRFRYLGRFKTVEEAAAVRKEHEKLLGFSPTHGLRL